MRILVAPQEFKGTLTATKAAAAIAAGVRAALPDAFVVEFPVSDGGAGLVDALLSARGGDRVAERVTDPLGRSIEATWGLLPDGSAVIEMAAASGLALLAPEERDPLTASTYGTGESIKGALQRGCRTLLIGVGGSATVDGGAGAMQALGARLLDTAGLELAHGGAALSRLAHVDTSPRHKALDGARLRVLSDVRNTLCGPEGAAATFGPQKGASPEDVRTLEGALRHFAGVLLRDTGVDVLSVPGGGAGGGLGAGLVALCGATIELGFPTVAEVTELAEAIAACDGVITGEGRLDAQTAYGKAASGVAAMARGQGKRIVAIAGSVEGDEPPAAFDGTVILEELAESKEAAMQRAHETLVLAGGEAAKMLARLVAPS